MHTCLIEFHLSFCSDLLHPTFCPVQERDEEAAAAAVVQGVSVAGESLAHILRGETDGHPGATISVPPRPQDTLTWPTPCSMATGEWPGRTSHNRFIHLEQGP
jgi:hypothetical protein